MQSSTVAQQAPARNLNRGWWPMLPEWSRRVLKPVLSRRTQSNPHSAGCASKPEYLWYGVKAPENGVVWSGGVVWST